MPVNNLQDVIAEPTVADSKLERLLGDATGQNSKADCSETKEGEICNFLIANSPVRGDTLYSRIPGSQYPGTGAHFDIHLRIMS